METSRGACAETRDGLVGAVTVIGELAAVTMRHPCGHGSMFYSSFLPLNLALPFETEPQDVATTHTNGNFPLPSKNREKSSQGYRAIGTRQLRELNAA